MLKITGVQKTFNPGTINEKKALCGIDLTLNEGDFVTVIGGNGAGKSTLLKIMAGVDTEIEGEAIPMPGIKIGYLPQEPVLDPEKTVRETVAEGLGDIFDAQEKLNKVYEAYADPDADFDALAAEQARLEAIIATGGPTEESILETIRAGANAITITPPTTGELFAGIMHDYREKKL